MKRTWLRGHCDSKALYRREGRHDQGQPEVAPRAQETPATDNAEADGRLKAIQDLIDYADNLPALGRPDGTSPDDDKTVLRERYM